MAEPAGILVISLDDVDGPVRNLAHSDTPTTDPRHRRAIGGEVVLRLGDRAGHLVDDDLAAGSGWAPTTASPTVAPTYTLPTSTTVSASTSPTTAEPSGQN